MDDPSPISETYATRVVGFVDILGFAELVRKADHDPILRRQISEALSRVRSTAPPGEGETGLRAQNFSDSLILSANATADGFWHLLLSVDALAWNLLQLGILIRGGITLGGIQHDTNTVFGVGVNDAYGLESRIAKFPRVVLGAKALAKARVFAAQEEVWEIYSQARLRRDFDGVWYLNYLLDLAAFNSQDDSAEMRRHPLFATGTNIRSIIQGKIDETTDSPDIYEKVEWLARYWNSEVVDNRLGTALGFVALAGEEPRGPRLPFRGF